MSQLTPSAIKQVRDALSRSSFSLADFDVQLPDEGNLLLSVEFRHREGYRFQVIERRERSKVKTSMGAGIFVPVREDTSEYTVMYALETPGVFKLRDRIEVDDFSAVLDRIPGWCKNIKENLSVAPLAKDNFEEFRASLEKQLDEQDWSDDERFAKDEIERLTNKLQEIAKRFEKLQEQNSMTQEQVDRIKKQLSELTNNASSFPKRTWGKVAGNKLIEIVTSFLKSKEARDIFIESIRKLISA
jgi:hypothetical protein